MAKAYNKQPLGRGLSALLNDSVKEINSIDDENSDQIICLLYTSPSPRD